MFSLLFTVLVVMIVLYFVLFTLKDNAAIGPIYNAVQPFVSGLVAKIKVGLAWIAAKITAATNKTPPK